MKVEAGKCYRNIYTGEIYDVKEVRRENGITVIVTDKGNWAYPLFQDCFVEIAKDETKE